MSRSICGVLVLCAVYFAIGCASDPAPMRPAPTSQKYIDQGRELVNGIAACGRCHGEKPVPGSLLVGGQLLNDRYGDVVAPNLTSAALKDWTHHDIVKALRQFVRPDGENLAVVHHSGYQWLADEDAYSIAAYIKSLPPVKNDVERRSISTISEYTTGLLTTRPKVAGFIPSISVSDKNAYGKYAVENLALCISCHNTEPTLFSETRYLGGGKVFEGSGGSSVAPNITGSKLYGIGEWSEEEIVEYLGSGLSAENRRVDTTLCPVDFYKNADSEVLASIAVYLLSVE